MKTAWRTKKLSKRWWKIFAKLRFDRKYNELGCNFKFHIEHCDQVKKKQNHSQLFVTESIANRRLSSPPALEKDVFYFNHMAQAYTKQHQKNHRKSRQSYDDCWDQDQGSGSSSTGSLQKLNISGLNPSSSDLRVNTVISGHQVSTLM